MKPTEVIMDEEVKGSTGVKVEEEKQEVYEDKSWHLLRNKTILK